MRPAKNWYSMRGIRPGMAQAVVFIIHRAFLLGRLVVFINGDDLLRVQIVASSVAVAVETDLPSAHA